MIESKQEFNDLLNRLKSKEKENKLGKSLQTKLQAFLEVEKLINLPLSGVGCRICGNDYNKLQKNNNGIRYCKKCDKAV